MNYWVYILVGIALFPYAFRILTVCLSWLVVSYVLFRKKNQGNMSKESAEGKKTEKCSGLIWFAGGIMKYAMCETSKIPSHVIRNLIYKRVFRVKMSKNVVVYSGTVFRNGYDCKIGEGTIIGDNCLLDARGGIEIGANCNLSSDVHIWTAQHDPQDVFFAGVHAPVIIGEHCWISSDVTVLPGVEIEQGCVIASGAVVTKKCEAYGIYAGVPAVRIAERNRTLEYVYNGEHDWFV